MSKLHGIRGAASGFSNPGPEYSASLWWSWDGPVDEAVIRKDLDAIFAMGISCVTIEAGYGMAEAYLSPGWFRLVKIAAREASKRNMRVWIVDEGKYPSGFAGGAFGRERPDLLMQALVVSERKPVERADFSKPLPPDTVAAIQVFPETRQALALEIRDNRILRLSSGFCPGDEIWLFGHQRKSSETRAVSNMSRGKDTENPLCDYLDARATKQFIAFTHEKYEKVLGDEFGKTVIGFRGDEPDFAFMPWTDRLPDEFRKRKGYDVCPFLGLFFAPEPSSDALRVLADYWDVWSGMFAASFFRVQAKWCGKRRLSYAVHLNHEDDMPALVKSEGDFFKCMRHVQVPGIDAIWNQIWPGKTADFPKLASSAAHVNGRKRAFTESFAAYKPQPDLQQAKWVLDHQFVRGINMVELMFYPSSVAASAPGTTAVLEG
ncbi:MAG: glycoside hydrolase, partial [Spirochaetaceae bacterium]